MTLRPLRGLSSNPETPAAKRLRPLAHSGRSYLEFLGNLMSWLTLGVRKTILACSTLHCSAFPDLTHMRAGFNGQEDKE